MNPKLVFSAALSLLLCFLHTGEAFSCHTCTTYDNPESECNDPFFKDSEGHEKENIQYQSTCDDPKAYFCRKIYQNVRGDERIIRSCGFEHYKVNESNCYKTVLEEYNTLVCQCFEENCNSSNVLRMSMMGVMVAGILAVLLH